MKIFKDRVSAGELLANRLKNTKADLVLGIPRGGVVVAAVVAEKLNLPLDIIVTRKIGAPGQKELALGAVDGDGEVVWGNQLLEQLEFKINDEIEEIKRREGLYRQGKKPLEVDSKAVILVDDGMATGATVLAAVNFLKRHQVKKIIVAAPVASREAVSRIQEVADEVMILEIPVSFAAVGQFYQEFEAVTDEEVVQLLA